MDAGSPPLETWKFHAAERVFFLLLFLCPNKEKVVQNAKIFERPNQRDELRTRPRHAAPPIFFCVAKSFQRLQD